jgi:hypothetical protein
MNFASSLHVRLNHTTRVVRSACTEAASHEIASSHDGELW